MSRIVRRKKGATRDNTYCCVPQCHTRSSEHTAVSFHNFPSELRDPIRRKQWILALKIGKEVTPRMKVCSKHFRPKDYILPEVSTWRPSLENFAVPSLNLPVLDPPIKKPSETNGSPLESKTSTKKILREEEKPDKVVYIVKVKAVDSSEESRDFKKDTVLHEASTLVQSVFAKDGVSSEESNESKKENISCKNVELGD